jgi:hypothetical protein
LTKIEKTISRAKQLAPVPLRGTWDLKYSNVSGRTIDMTTEELSELFLSHLYDLAEAAPHPNYMFSVNDFAPSYGVTTVEELEKALNLLSDKGLVILAGFDVFGGISAGITVEGSIFVENGGETGIIPRYKVSPNEFITHTPGPINSDTPSEIKESIKPPVATSTPGTYPRRTIDALFLDMEDILQSDRSLSDSTITDAIADLAALKAQLSRSKKNNEVLKALASSLSAIPSLNILMSALYLLLDAPPKLS